MRIFLLLVASTFFYFTANAQNCGARTEPSYQVVSTSDCMPNQIQSLIGNAETVQKIGELPNGDIVFIISGISKLIPVVSHECLLIKSNLFNKWEILGCNPSRDSIRYTLAVATINNKWEIEVSFQRGAEIIPAVFSLKQLDFVFTSPQDEEKVKGQLPHVNLY